MPFSVTAVTERLSEQVPALQKIGTAIEYASIKSLSSFRTPSAFVILLSERAVNDTERKVSRINVEFGVVIAVRNFRDGVGVASAQDADTVINAVRSALIGYRAGLREEGAALIQFKEGQVQDYDDSALLWSDVFTTSYYYQEIV